MMDKAAAPDPVFQICREDGGLLIRVPVKADRFRSLLNLVWILIWVIVEGGILLHLLGAFGPPRTPPVLPMPLTGMFLVAFSVAGGWVCWRWLWSQGGQESFRVRGGALLVRRELWGIGLTRRFELAALRSIRAGGSSGMSKPSSWARMFIGHGEGEIVVDAGGRTFVYGKGLEEAEARELADLLADEIAHWRHKPRQIPASTAFLG